MKKKIISPSFLSANFLDLRKDIEIMNNSQADWFHIDVMDGIFVPNISFGFPIISQIKNAAKKPLDVHIMITNPDKYIKHFADVGANILTVHYEACKHLHRTIQNIKLNGMKAGVALNPHTPTFLLNEIITDIDVALIMSVNPGYAGQNFIENSLQKITELKEIIIKKNSNALIEVDGGISTENAGKIFKSGADILVAGNSIFKSKNPTKTVSDLKNS